MKFHRNGPLQNSFKNSGFHGNKTSDLSVFHCSMCVVNFLACVRSRGHIFSPIIMKLGQNVCLDEISDEMENWTCGFKNLLLGQILEKLVICPFAVVLCVLSTFLLVYALEATFQPDYHEFWSECLS